MLKNFQKIGLGNIIKAFEKAKIVILAWYTGSGKTNIYIEFIKLIRKAEPSAVIGISAYFTTEIRQQTIERLKSLGLGNDYQEVFNGVEINPNKKVLIFIPQAIYKDPPQVKLDYLIIDEIQTGTSDEALMMNSVYNACVTKNTKVLGCSATPWDVLDQERFKDAIVLKRSMQDGLEDKNISDIIIKVEENQIEFSDSDFTRKGDLSSRSKNLQIIKSVCFGFFKTMLKKYDDEIGDKCLVICPPGNVGEIARSMADEFNGLCTIGAFTNKRLSLRNYGTKESSNLSNQRKENKYAIERFKTDPKVRFLFVVNKCGVGFDYSELTSVIDLTMTRNITTLVQRLGRPARLSTKSNKLKHYFYMSDKGLANRVNWLFMTAVDVSLGNWDGFKTKTFKYKETNDVIGNDLRKESRTLSSIINQLTDKNIKNTITLRYTEQGPKKNRTLQSGIEELKQYKSRPEMFNSDPALYKWFRINYPKVLNKILPPVKRLGYWNEKTVISSLKKCKSRTQFRNEYAGAEYWVTTRKRNDLLDKYLPSKIRSWTHDKVIESFSTVKTWPEFRALYPGARAFIMDRKMLKEYREIFMRMHPKV